jgi:hypothetical protein
VVLGITVYGVMQNKLQDCINIDKTISENDVYWQTNITFVKLGKFVRFTFLYMLFLLIPIENFLPTEEIIVFYTILQI